MKHWKSISATLLAASLVTSTAGLAWADETEKVDSSTFKTVDLQEALKNVKDETVTSEDLEVISAIVPVGYMANNITALSLNLEKISNPRAKEALQENIDRAIARWEAKNKVEEETEVETPEEEVVATPEEGTTEEEVVTPEEETTEEEPVAVVSEEEKEEEKTEAELAAKKAEALAKKEAKKAEIAAKKEAKKAEIAAKKEAKKLEKEERKANKEEKRENKGEKDKE